MIMGSKGNNRHIKSLAAPRYLHIERKVNAYVLKPNAGRHTLAYKHSTFNNPKGEAKLRTDSKRGKAEY